MLVELTGDDRRWPELLDAAARQARAIGAALDVRIVTADESTVDRGVAGLNGLPVARLGVFDPHTHISMPTLWRALRGHPATRTRRRSGSAAPAPTSPS